VGALVADPTTPRAEYLPLVCASLEELLGGRPDVVVEVAGHAAWQPHGPAVLGAGIDLMLVSVGATGRACRRTGDRGGSECGWESGDCGSERSAAWMRSRRPLSGAKQRHAHDAQACPDAPREGAHLDAPCELFRGSAREGALRFPESINVAAAVSLAGTDSTAPKCASSPTQAWSRTCMK